MGTALCYGDGYVYAIKGGNRQDFYAYNIIQDPGLNGVLFHNKF